MRRRNGQLRKKPPVKKPAYIVKPPRSYLLNNGGGNVKIEGIATVEPVIEQPKVEQVILVSETCILCEHPISVQDTKDNLEVVLVNGRPTNVHKECPKPEGVSE